MGFCNLRKSYHHIRISTVHYRYRLDTGNSYALHALSQTRHDYIFILSIPRISLLLMGYAGEVTVSKGKNKQIHMLKSGHLIGTPLKLSQLTINSVAKSDWSSNDLISSDRLTGILERIPTTNDITDQFTQASSGSLKRDATYQELI